MSSHTCCVCGCELSPQNHTRICAEDRLLARNGDLADEVWLPVIGFRGWEISNHGRIRDAGTHQIREPDRSGRYPRISLNGRRRAIHTLMAETFSRPEARSPDRRAAPAAPSRRISLGRRQIVNKNNANRYENYQKRTSRPIPVVRLTP